LANPSVHIITLDPGFPLDAKVTDANNAGPRAVPPLGLRASNYVFSCVKDS